MVQLIGREVGHTGFGLMGLTWRPQPIDKSAAINVMKTAFTNNATFCNVGTFYGTPQHNSLHLIHDYFTTYPTDATSVIISIKGPVRGDEASVRRVVDESLKILNGKKSLDIYQCARVDSKVPIEDTIRILSTYIEAANLSGISLSEASAANIRRAAKIHPIACYEVEFSLFAPEILTNGIIETCYELKIPIIAYSPLGRGFLTDSRASQRADDLPAGDIRKNFPRIQPGNFENNMKLADEVARVANRKGCSIGQIALAWVRWHSKKPGFPEIIPIPGATTSKRVEENGKVVELSEDEFEELEGVRTRFEILGTRYP